MLQLFWSNILMSNQEKNCETLSVDINPQIFAEFQSQWKTRGQVRNRAVQAALKLWIELPVEIQARLIDQKLDGLSFIELVQEIVDERIAKGYADGGKFLAKHQKRKPTQKD